MKKIVYSAMTLALALAFVACGNNTADGAATKWLTAA